MSSVLIIIEINIIFMEKHNKRHERFNYCCDINRQFAIETSHYFKAYDIFSNLMIKVDSVSYRKIYKLNNGEINEVIGSVEGLSFEDRLPTDDDDFVDFDYTGDISRTGDNVILLLLSSLKDHNDEYIYQDDILELKINEKKLIVRVEYINDGFFIKINDKYEQLSFIKKYENVKVIGNMYQNKDIVKKYNLLEIT